MSSATPSPASSGDTSTPDASTNRTSTDRPSTDRTSLVGRVGRCGHGHLGLITGRTELAWGLSWVGVYLSTGAPWASRAPELVPLAALSPEERANASALAIGYDVALTD